MSVVDTLPAQITIDSLVLGALDGDVAWGFESIDGWHNGPGVQVDQEQRIVSHGQFGQPGHRTGRTITVNGWVLGDTRGPVAAALRELDAVLADGQFSTFTVDDVDEGVLSATVQLLDRLQVDWSTPTEARFQIQLLAPDPYRYGAVSSDSTGFAMDAVGAGLVFPLFPGGVLDFGALGDPGIASVSNAGTASASVVFRVAGPADGFTITDTTTGKRVTYLGDLPAGSELVLDGRDGSVVIDGVADRSGDTVVEAWPVLGAGQSRDFLFAPLGGTTAAVLTTETTATYW